MEYGFRGNRLICLACFLFGLGPVVRKRLLMPLEFHQPLYGWRCLYAGEDSCPVSAVVRSVEYRPQQIIRFARIKRLRTAPRRMLDNCLSAEEEILSRLSPSY